VSDDETPRPPRRKRYSGKNPRRFEDKYKEHDPARYGETIAKVIASGKTPAGSHIPILTEECLDALQLAPGMSGVDATLGYGGHAARILEKIAPDGKLIGLDLDPLELPKTSARLRAMGFGGDRFEAVRSNYAGIAKVLAERGLAEVDFIFADLGCSSMQFDDPSRPRPISRGLAGESQRRETRNRPSRTRGRTPRRVARARAGGPLVSRHPRARPRDPRVRPRERRG
jgi:16S rRNA (cytosine1402-N4)-methyltransferase